MEVARKARRVTRQMETRETIEKEGKKSKEGRRNMKIIERIIEFKMGEDLKRMRASKLFIVETRMIDAIEVNIIQDRGVEKGRDHQETRMIKGRGLDCKKIEEGEGVKSDREAIRFLGDRVVSTAIILGVEICLTSVEGGL